MARYCSRCGFPLDGVIHLLHNRGLLPTYQVPEGPMEPSPRRRGVRQGGIIFLTGILLVPILGVLSTYTDSSFIDVLVRFAALVCFVGGPLRMIYAALFEEGAPARNHVPVNSYSPPPPAPHRPAMPGALPPAAANPATGWRQRPNTAEVMQPPSITENTTRLLDKEEPREH
jgi:hypothetical protein